MEESVKNMELSFNNIKNIYELENKDIKTISPLVFAYIGDSVYDLIIKSILVAKGNIPVNKLHKKASELVKANAQVKMYEAVKEMLTEDEISIFKRGRNAKSYTSAKNATIGDYRIATGYEALFGYWYLSGQTERMLEMAQKAMEEK